MTKIDIISGFLGAGKTTLIRKLIAEAFIGEQIVLIENEFGEINIDGGFLKDSGIQISEMTAGCICCTLVGDFKTALTNVYEQYKPARIIIEPSGVGKLSDVILAVENATAENSEMQLNSFMAVVDGKRAKMYMENFGEFYNNQVETAGTIVISRTQKMSAAEVEDITAFLREHNAEAAIITTPWDEIDGKIILNAIEKVSLEDELMSKIIAEHEAEEEAHHHHHHHDHDDEECECHHHHHDHDEDENEHEHHHHHHHDDEECECHHHHHDDDDEEHGHHHHHHHDHDGECSCGCGHDHHHGHHHADEVFTSWGKETPHKYSREEISNILNALDGGSYGHILRAKGIVGGADGSWIEFDYVPGESEIRSGQADYTGRICVIGASIDEAGLGKLFGI